MKRMISARYLLRHRSMLALLAMVMVLRSLIAPGFMLETSAETPLGFTLTLCEGFGSFDRIDTDIVSVHAHGDHSTHSGHDNVPAGNNPANENHGMPSVTCAALSVSSAYIEIPHDVSGLFYQSVVADIRPDFIAVVIRTFNSLPQQPRAPPFLS